MYVREARRIVGRHVFKEHDNSLAPGLGRTPIHPDSIAVTDWYMDSHACTTESRPGFKYDGKLILTEESRPGADSVSHAAAQGRRQPARAVCMSATHIAWGRGRLEPVWMQTGESAGLRRNRPGEEDKKAAGGHRPDKLVRTLASRRYGELLQRRQPVEGRSGDRGEPVPGDAGVLCELRREAGRP